MDDTGGRADYVIFHTIRHFPAREGPPPLWPAASAMPTLTNRFLRLLTDFDY